MRLVTNFSNRGFEFQKCKQLFIRAMARATFTIAFVCGSAAATPWPVPTDSASLNAEQIGTIIAAQL